MDQKTRWTRYSHTTASVTAPEDAPARNRLQHDDRYLRAQRVRLLTALFLIIILIVMVRLFYWHTIGRPAQAQPQAAQTVEVRRGRIVDANGLLLATDSFVWEVYANPLAYQPSANVPALLADLTQIIGRPADNIQAALAQNNLSVITLAKGVTEDQCKAIAGLGKPGLVWCKPRRVRGYPQGPLGAHLIGFSSYDLVGLYGVEASYDAWLRSSARWSAQRFPSVPLPLPETWKLYLPSPGGRDLALYLNAPLQHLVERQLAEALAHYEAEAGTIIVMDVRTGGLLALANLPAFDPNSHSDVDPETWVNSAVSKIYEPGSVFKLITLAAALDSGLVTPNTILEDKGYLQIGNRFIRNAERKTYGEVAVRDVLARSINVVTAQICLDMGAETFYRYVRQFGFGKLTEVDLQFESYGIVKEPGNPLWSYFDLATNSFGQGISVTALQMLNAAAAIANGGKLQQPQVARGLIKDGQLYNLPPRTLGYPIKPETARTLTEMMVYTVDSAAFPDPVPGYRVAGKTGTAEIPTEQGYLAQETITSFVGFLPAADPQVVILVKLMRPKRSRWAEHVAVPVFGQVAQDAMRVLKVPPDNRAP